MPDNPHEKIYGRDEAEAFVKEKLSVYIDFLQDLANFGSDLIPRCYVSSNRTPGDTVLIASLLKHVVCMLDGIVILLKQGAVFPSELQLRSLFEAHAYIQWILKSDTERKALQYSVWHWRRDLDWTRSVLEGTKENERLNAALNPKAEVSTAYISSMKGRQDEVKAKEKELLELLNAPEFKEVNDEFERLRTDNKGKRSKRDRDWYSLFSGPSNLRQLCEKLSIEGEYDIFYSSSSEVAHATTQKKMISHQGGEIIFEQIRNMNRFDQIVRYSSSLIFRTYRIILEKYRPEEAAGSFKKRYREEWRKPFMTIPKVVVEGGEVTKI
jgi:hypothetical protein